MFSAVRAFAGPFLRFPFKTARAVSLPNRFFSGRFNIYITDNRRQVKIGTGFVLATTRCQNPGTADERFALNTWRQAFVRVNVRAASAIK